MTGQQRVLIIQARNLGDAVISTALVETIAHGFPAAKIDVLTRPEIAQIFAHNPHVEEIITGRLPMSSLHDFGLKAALVLPGLMNKLRRKGYTDVVNLTGDFREEFIGRVITRKNNWSPAWAADHPCRKTIRPSIIRLANRPITIPSTTPNIHDAAAIIGTAVTSGTAQKPALYTPEKKRITWNPLERAVGIHPMASQPWRRWELEKWNLVAKALIENEIDVHVFGAPSEAKELTQHFCQLDASRISIVTGSLSNYFAAVSRMRVLLCPDSSASHVAYALGVPTILLNGANDATAWAPPGSTVLAAGPGLSCYPCYNRPTCFGGADEYACVRRIQMKSVLETVWEVLESTGRECISVLPQTSRS
jgi:heptosyltransferase-3